MSTLKLWKKQLREVIKEHHGKPIYCVAFNTYDQSNQDLVASVGGYQDSEQEDFYVCKWTVEAETGHPLLLLAGKLALIRVVNCHKKTAVKTLKGHGKDVNDISVHPAHPHLVLSASKDFHPWDPYLFVSGAMEGAVKVWSIKEHWVGVEASQQWEISPRQRAFPVRLVGHPVFSSRQIKLWRPLYPHNPILETSSKFVLLRVFDFTGDVMWWLRFSVDPLGQVLACGNTQVMEAVNDPMIP
eukprot:gene10052-10208_t